MRGKMTQYGLVRVLLPCSLPVPAQHSSPREQPDYFRLNLLATQSVRTDSAAPTVWTSRRDSSLIATVVTQQVLARFGMQRHGCVTTRAADSLPTFVELPASTLATAAGECILEFEKPEGSKLRVHLKGVQVPDLLALGAGFWNAE